MQNYLMYAPVVIILGISLVMFGHLGKWFLLVPLAIVFEIMNIESSLAFFIGVLLYWGVGLLPLIGAICFKKKAVKIACIVAQVILIIMHDAIVIWWLSGQD